MKINFFLNMPSIHQAPLIRQLNKKLDVSVFYDTPVSKLRHNLGWYTPDFGTEKVYDLSKTDINKLVHTMDSDTINVFSGLAAYPNIHSLFKKCIKTEAKNYIQLESLKLTGFKGRLRKLKYLFLRVIYDKKINGVLSQGGKEQLKSLGYTNVRDFFYYIDKPTENKTSTNSKTKFIYLGALSKNKRIMDLISGFPQSESICLDIYGAELDVTIDELKKELKKSTNINYKGTLKNNAVIEVIKKYDYLVLPSKAEGWGVVASEALLAGTGVLITHTAGISKYLNDNHYFTNNVHIINFNDMKRACTLIKELHPLTPQERKNIQKQAYFLSSEYGSKDIMRYWQL